MKHYNFIALISFLFSISLFASNNGYNLIKSDYQQGVISYENYIKQSFYYGFKKASLETKYKDAEPSLLKCGTELVREYKANKNKLSSETVNEIESILKPQTSSSMLVYISPYGKFQMNYEISGTNAVPVADNNGNGVPDYVEWCADYMDYSWKYEIDTLGNLAPPIGGGLYQVFFEAMDYYGYTEPVGGALTKIVLHNNFAGFPNNTDPEGKQKGAAKVTCAHEFKHAIQIVYNNWNEPGWFIEMDATWMEDYAYDNVNDYYNYLPSSQIANPDRSFNDGSGYEDCLWMHYMTQKYGVQLNKEIWGRRNIYGSEDIYATFNNVLLTYSSDFVKGLKEYVVWNAFTGLRTNSLVKSYEEASHYPTVALCKQNSIPDTAQGCGMSELSSNVLSFSGSNLSSMLKLNYHGNSSVAQSIEGVIFYKNNTSEKIDLDADGSGAVDYVLQKPISDISSVTLIPVITENKAGSYSYSYNLKAFVAASFSFAGLKDIETPQQRTVIIKAVPDGNFAVMDSLKLYYKTSTGGFTALQMIADGNANEYSAVLPSFPSGTTVYYYFSLYDNTGNYTYYPAKGSSGMLSYYTGPDNTSPYVTHNVIVKKTRFDFPFTLFATANDNMGVDSFYVDYSINNGDYVRENFNLYKDTVFYARINPDTSKEITSFSYRITAVDKSLHKNISQIPLSGYNNVTIEPAFRYLSSNEKIIKDGNLFGIRDTVIVPDNIGIQDLKVVFKADHNRANDLTVKLFPPFGTAIYPLMKSVGEGTIFQNIKNPDVVFDQSAYLTLTPFAPIDSVNLTGEYKADTTNFNYFNNKSAAGRWIIIVSDLKAGETGTLKKWGVIITPTSIASIEDKTVLPEGYTLYQNYPNPFNPSTKIRYYLPERSEVVIKLYNMLGKELLTLVSGLKDSGMHEEELNTTSLGLSSGVYFYKLTSGNFSQTKKLMLLK